MSGIQQVLNQYQLFLLMPSEKKEQMPSFPPSEIFSKHCALASGKVIKGPVLKELKFSTRVNNQL